MCQIYHLVHRSKELRKSINTWPFLLHVVSKTIRGGNLSSLDSSLQVSTSSTRQVMIIALGEPELCCSMARCGVACLSERVEFMHTRMHYVSRMQCTRVVPM